MTKMTKQQQDIQQDQRSSSTSNINDCDDDDDDHRRHRSRKDVVDDREETHRQQQQREEEEEPPPRKRARMTTMADTSVATRTAPPAAASVTYIASNNGRQVTVGSNLNNDEKAKNKKQLPSQPPSNPAPSMMILHNVRACLSGLPYEEKEHYHQLILTLGGTYTRNLISTENTHLITAAKNCNVGSAKYELAMQCSNIAIVTPDWLDICYKTQSYVNERKYSLKKETPVQANSSNGDVVHVDEEADDANTNTTGKMEESLDRILLSTNNGNGNAVETANENDESILNNRSGGRSSSNNNNNNNKIGTITTETSSSYFYSKYVSSSLFVSCHFLLVGFDNDNDNNDNDGVNGQNGALLSSSSTSSSLLSFKNKLCKLIRRGQGTIYWDIHPRITHIIVHYHPSRNRHDGSDKDSNDDTNGYDVLR